MASIKPYKAGYRAQVYVLGVRDSETFRTRREAEAWAHQRETELREKKPASLTKTLRDAMERYRDEITVGKRGEVWEAIRIKAFLADADFPGGKKLCELVPEDFGRWRDARLKSVSAGTLLRDFSTLSPILEHARTEWKWIETNPLKDVKKPREPDHREVTIPPMDSVRLLRAMGYRRQACRSSTQAVAVAYLFALRVGMRAGEICALRWSDVFDGYVKVTGYVVGAGKTRSAKRDVPIVYQAGRLIALMEGWDDEFVFGIKSQTLDAMFRRYRDRAGLAGITFHDTRHTAATRLSEKVDVLTLCKIFGWKNTKQALTYYNPKVDTIRRMLEPSRSRKSGSSRTG